MKKNGFTLIELLITIGIIALMAGIVMPRMNDINESAKQANIQGNLSSLRTSIAMYNVLEGHYPLYEGSNRSIEDIYKSGDVSKRFEKYYSKSKFPSIPTMRKDGVTIKESNKVLDHRDDSGGWMYIESDGELYVNISEKVIDEEGDNESPLPPNKVVSGEDLEDFIKPNDDDDDDEDENGRYLDGILVPGIGEDEVELRFKANGNNNTSQIVEEVKIKVVAPLDMEENEDWEYVEGSEYEYTTTNHKDKKVFEPEVELGYKGNGISEISYK